MFFLYNVPHQPDIWLAPLPRNYAAAPVFKNRKMCFCRFSVFCEGCCLAGFLVIGGRCAGYLLESTDEGGGRNKTHAFGDCLEREVSVAVGVGEPLAGFADAVFVEQGAEILASVHIDGFRDVADVGAHLGGKQVEYSPDVCSFPVWRFLL